MAPAVSRRTWWLLLLFGLLGLTSSSASAFVHYRLMLDPTATSICDINETWSCVQVYESAYGAVGGVSVAVFGVVWFAFVTLLMLAGARARTSAETGFAHNVPSYVFVLSVPALAAVLYLGYASLFVLQAYCVFCLITYVAVIGLFLVSGAAADGVMTQLPSRAARDVRGLLSSPAALGVAGLFGVAAAALFVLYPRQLDATSAAETAAVTAAPMTQAQQSEFERWFTSLPREPIAVPTEGAKVLIVKFNDYQCPPCKQTYLAYKPIIDKHTRENPGQVRYVSKDYPLEPECNVNAPGGVHLAACEAAVAVRLARAQGKAEAMEKWLFDNQPQLTPDLVRQAAASVGGVTDFAARYAPTLELVKSDVQLGGSLDVRGTPTFFINGVRIPVIKPEYLDAAIVYELTR